MPEAKLIRYNDNTEEQGEINTILRILEDQYPLSMPKVEIASLVNISAEKIELCLRFLAKYSFITYDEQRETAVICTDFFSLK